MNVTPVLIDLVLDEHRRRIADAVRRAQLMSDRTERQPRRTGQRALPRPVPAPLGCAS